MIAFSHRLRAKEVAEVLKRGRGLPSGRYVSAKVLQLPEAAGATIRSAAVVSKKVAKSAVARNRIRRAVYDAVRAASGGPFAASSRPVHIVFFVRAAPQTALRGVFEEDITNILNALAARR